jgi:hypothetical protein
VKIKIFGAMIALVLALSLCLVMAVPALADGGEVTLSTGVYTNKLDLENKDPSDWKIKTDGIGGTLGYNASGSNFVYGVEATGLAVSCDYALIYYADFSGDRYGTWGGNNPGAVIGYGTSNSDGDLTMSGSPNLCMDLPCPPDANQFEHDYSGDPDYYTNAHGAKIWLIPKSALSSGVLPVQAWPPDDTWLFETDLITYDDIDVDSTILEITVDPASLDFGILTPGDTGTGGLTVTNTGGEPADVAASVASGVFDYLQLDSGAVGAWGTNLPWMNTYVDVVVTLPVPGDYTPTGPETGTLTFTATPSS